MAFQPRFALKARQRQVVPEESRQMAPLEATGVAPLVAGAVVRGSALPTASVITHPGCAMRMSVPPTFRKCRSRDRNKDGPDRSKRIGWLEKVDIAIRYLNNTAATEIPLIQQQSRTALPQISKGGKDFEKPAQKLPHPPACSSHPKGAPPGNDMTPWTGPSASESSFHALFEPVVSSLHSVPFPAIGTHGSCSFFPELEEKAPTAAGEQRHRVRFLQGQTKQKAKSRGFPKHFKSKLQGTKLPPLPSITNLNFSRNFTFSFFELPPHQSHQQLICLLMKQLS